MGGINSGVVFGQSVRRGDLCNVEIFREGQSRFLLAIFQEISDCGAAWFKFYSEHESLCGDSYFSDHFMGVGEIVVIGAESTEMFAGDGI